jgi:hypothetical protein
MIAKKIKNSQSGKIAPEKKLIELFPKLSFGNSSIVRK